MNSSQQGFNFQTLLDSVIRITAIALLVIWCYEILHPFLVMIAGGAILAIALFPLYEKLQRITGNRSWLSAICLLLPLSLLLLLPGWYMTNSVFQEIKLITQYFEQTGILIPPPPASASTWPMLLQPLVDLWSRASLNLNDLIHEYSSQLTGAGTYILVALKDAGMGVLELLVSFFLSGFLLVLNQSFSSPFKKVFNKLAGSNGDHLYQLTLLTVRNVMTGVVGVAIFQTFLASIGLFAVEVPYAGLWTMVCLVLAISQIGLWPAFLLSVLYGFSALTIGPTLLLSGSLLVAALSEQVLKPVLLGRNSPVPMMILFIGSIGGFLYMGFTGLFLGPILFTLIYQAALTWLNESD